MSSNLTLKESFRLKVAMITRGVLLPSIDSIARTGGAGPTLGRYFLINNKIVVNAPVRSGEQAKQFHALNLERISEDRYHIVDFEGKTPEIVLAKRPDFYQMQLTDGTPMTHIALVHGVDCLATTLVQHCAYFDSGLQCQYCSIPVSLEQGNTILHKSPDQFLEVLQQAQGEGCATHLTLTMGSPNREDRGIQEYVDFVSTIRQHSTIPIHVQLEPPEPLDLLDELKEAGIDTVGIHLETYSDTLRAKFCPGKFKHASFVDYQNAWRRAVALFGRGQVDTFILLGLGETSQELHQGFETTVKLGVIPVPVPCRPNPGSKMEGQIPNYVENLDKIVDIYLDCARLLHQYKLNPMQHLAGCIRCTGCTAITEAYQIITSDS